MNYVILHLQEGGIHEWHFTEPTKYGPTSWIPIMPGPVNNGGQVMAGNVMHVPCCSRVEVLQ